MTRRRDRGQTLVEFAVVLPLFILILVGIFDFGRAIYAYHTLLNASREAARQAVVDQTLTHIEERAVDHAVALGLAAGDVNVDYRRVSTPNAAGSCNANVGSPQVVGCIAVVRLEYTYDAAVPLISALVGQITLSGESRFPVHHDCQEPGSPQCPLGDGS
jgi:Flp pilus assembly protein TadG